MLFFITFVVLALSKLLLMQLRSGEGTHGMSARRPRRIADADAAAAAHAAPASASASTSVALTLSLAAMAFGLFWLVWILVETVRLGIGGLSLSLFTEMTPPPQAETGGLANAIFGSLMMVTLATLLGTPIGILAGIYLAEYGQKTWLGSAHPLHQRHPAVGAVDRHRPVHLRRRRRPRSRASRAGPASWRWR